MPIAAQAQGRVRRIGALMPFSADDPQAQARYTAFLQGLQQLGWIDGRNVRIEVRWSPNNAAVRKNRRRTGGVAPDLIFTSGSVSMGILAQTDGARGADRVHDRSGSSRRRLCREPRATGRQRDRVYPFEYGIGGKWLELLRELRPGVARAAILRDPTVSAGIGLWGAIQAVAPSLGIDIFPVRLRETAEIDRAFGGLASAPNGGAYRDRKLYGGSTTRSDHRAGRPS